MSLYKRNDSPFYWVKIQHQGRKVQRSTGTKCKKEAQLIHNKLETELIKQSEPGYRPRFTWAEAVVEWVDETSGKKTHNDDLAKLVWLDKMLGDKYLDEINQACIKAIKKTKTGEGVTVATVNRYLALIRSILNKAKDEWEMIEKVPTISLEREFNNRVRWLSADEAKRLLDELPEHQRDLVTFALATGLRQSNVVGLEWEKVDLKLKHAYVVPEESKTGAAIPVPLNDVALEVLNRVHGNHPTNVFTYKGKPFKAANTAAWKKALARAGIEDFRWHDLRHTWASWQIQSGTTTHELQILGGWSTPAMVARYAHLGPGNLGTAAARINSQFPRGTN